MDPHFRRSKQDMVPPTTRSYTVERWNHASPLADHSKRIEPTVSKLDEDDQGRQRVERMLSQSLVPEEDSKTLTRRMIRHPLSSEFLTMKPGKPTDTVRGIADSNSTNSSISSFSPSLEQSEINYSTPFNIDTIQHMAAWSDKRQSGHHHLQAFNIHPVTKPEAQAVAEKMIQARGKTANHSFVLG